MMARLDLFERFIVVDVLRRIVKIENDFRVAVRQKTIDRVLGIQSFVINKVVDKLIQRKSGDVNLKNHLRGHSLTGLTGFSRRII